jgi:3-hydroxyisobutyrate dehydrogenase
MRNLKTISILGLGLMGSRMAAQLAQKGFALRVYNRTPGKADVLKPLGVYVASSPADAAANSDAVISMLSDDAASREVWLGEHGAINSARPDCLLIESGTVSVPWISELAAAAIRQQCKLLDAPVSGSKAQAETGQLLFLVGGDSDALASAAPIFNALGRAAIHLGESGSGARMKLINNFLTGVQLASFAEALAWIERSALNKEAAVDLLCNGAGGSPMIKNIAPRMLQQNYAVNFLLRLLAKDFSYITNDAASFGLELNMGNETLTLLKTAQNLGFGELDMSAVVEQFRDQAKAIGN